MLFNCLHILNHNHTKMKTINFLIAILIGLSSQLLTAQKLDINTESSTVEWVGKKIGGQHDGNILLKSGSLELKDGHILKGNFVVDMTSMTNADLTNEGSKQKLIGHLKSDDFFGVEKYPTASFVITASSKFTNGKATITGNMTIKGKTESITFETVKAGNNYTSKIEIDRSKFDVRYGSKSFFKNLGDKAINDIFTLDIKLVTK